MTKQELQKKIEKLEEELVNSGEKHVTDVSRAADMLVYLSVCKCPADYKFFHEGCGGCLTEYAMDESSNCKGQMTRLCWQDFVYGEFQDCNSQVVAVLVRVE